MKLCLHVFSSREDTTRLATLLSGVPLCCFFLYFALTFSKRKISRVDWEKRVAKTAVKLSINATELPAETRATRANDSAGEAVIVEREQLLIVYTTIIVLGTICVVGRSFSSFRMCLRISINLHDMIFRGITRAKMAFFNNNPSGRILNRFARDINNIDSLLPSIMIDVLQVGSLIDFSIKSAVISSLPSILHRTFCNT